MQSLVLSTTVVNIYSRMSFPSWSVWQTCAKVILVAVFVWPLSHTISALFNAKTFTLPLFLAFDRMAKNWFSSLPSERRLLLYIFRSCFTPKRLFVLLQLYHSNSIGAFVVVIQTGKGDFTPLRYFVAKRKLKMQVLRFAVLSCCKKLVLKLKWGPHYDSPPWEFTIIRRDVAKNPIFTTTWIFTFHLKCNRESAFRELSLSQK